MMVECGVTVPGSNVCCSTASNFPKPDVSHVVKLSSLDNMLKWLSADNDHLFKKEFKEVEEDLDLSAREGVKPHNRAKNRYSGFISYDHSRVRLQSVGDDGSDYINASWIEGEGGKRMYIAAQAPLQYTVSDMWRMVWEYRVRVILMTTTLTEDGNEKCVQYWPATEGEALKVDSSSLGGELRVTLETSEEHSHWCLRVLSVEERTLTGDQVKEAPFKVYHYHFTDWPDCGVPSSPSPLLNLLRHIHTTHSLPSSPLHSPPPLLVHCSAGVGRTGTLLAVDRLLHQLQAGAHSVNVLQTVRELRRCRPRMVQNEVQYKFIYSCLADMIGGNGIHSATTAAEHTQDSTQSSPGNSGASINDNFPTATLEH